MGTVNRVILVGNLGKDAEVRCTPGGTAVSTISLATTEVWNDKSSGERVERTEWHRVVLWGKQAETLNDYLKKGKQIYVEGKLQTRKWQDRDGNDKYTTEIRSDRIVLLGGRGGGGGGGGEGGDYGSRGSAPGGSAPGGSAPGGSAPGGSAPGGSTGGGAAPGPPELTEDDIPF